MQKTDYSLYIKQCALSVVTLVLFGLHAPSARAQVNSGSNGSDGAFNPAQSVTIDMTDHPDGIYQYTSINIPSGVTVTFKSNASNTPVTWLVQGNCEIDGTVDVSGQAANGSNAGIGGVGGWIGGNGGSSPGSGGGPGGGGAGNGFYGSASGGSFATAGAGASPGPLYGSIFLLPLQGGSGGGGAGATGGGGGGGGAILIAADNFVQVNGNILASGGEAFGANYGDGSSTHSGGGSGGSVRVVTQIFKGTGNLTVSGGSGFASNSGGNGRVRIDAYQDTFSGTIVGTATQGFQPIIIPAAGQGIQLAIASIAGTAVSGNPSGVLGNPDVIIPGQQSSPIPIVVSCTNLSLNTAITVVAHPADGADVQAVGVNNVGTVALSTATVSMNLPQGGGIIYADCLSGITTGTSSTTSGKTQSYARTGLTADGERISAVEIIAKAGAPQQTVYRTSSGKRLMIANK